MWGLPRFLIIQLFSSSKIYSHKIYLLLDSISKSKTVFSVSLLLSLSLCLSPFSNEQSKTQKSKHSVCVFWCSSFVYFQFFDAAYRWQAQSLNHWQKSLFAIWTSRMTQCVGWHFDRFVWCGWLSKAIFLSLARSFSLTHSPKYNFDAHKLWVWDRLKRSRLPKSSIPLE